MNKLIWTLQVLLAVVFLAHGVMFLNPPAEYVEMMNAQLGVGFRLFLGVAEVLAAIGLIAPALTRILPWLTPLAAAGVMIIMVAATGMHFVRAEYSSTVTTAILLAMATFVAYQRWKVRPIAPRTVPVMARSSAHS